MRELWRGVAVPADCGPDGLGLPGVAAAVCEALDALAAELGLGSFEATRATSALMARDIRVWGATPIAAEQALTVVGGLAGVEETSLRAWFALRDPSTETLLATAVILADHVETRTAKAFAWSSRSLKAADALRTSAGDAPPEPQWSPEPRIDLGTITPSARGVFRASEADSFGRVRAPSLLARMAGRGRRPAARLAIHAFPSAGDRFVVTLKEKKTGREQRAALDPGRGALWATLEILSA